MRFVSEQLYVHVSDVGNVDRPVTLSMSFLPLFGYIFKGPLAGRLRQEVQKPSIFGWSSKSLGGGIKSKNMPGFFKT